MNGNMTAEYTSNGPPNCPVIRDHLKPLGDIAPVREVMWQCKS